MSSPIWNLGPDREGRSVGVVGETIAESLPTAALHLDCSGARIQPGGINAHTHLYSGLAALGMPAPEPKPQGFLQILEQIWWRLDRALNAQSLRAAARLYVAEALLAGTTCLIDHHESPELIEGSLDVLAEVCEELGMRALLGYGATERNGGRAEADRGLAECRRFLREGAGGLLRGAVALHASFTVSDPTLRAAGELCREFAAPLHIHLAEDAADVVDAQSRGYGGPLERLLAQDVPLEGAILAHGVHLQPTQVQQAEAAGAWLIHNPRSNQNNGVGYAAALRMSDRVALGTDGFPAEMDAEAQALESQDQVRRTAYAEAARQLVGGIFGCSLRADLRPGSTADLCVVDDQGCRFVLVAGQLVVREGKLTRASIEEIRAIAAESAPQLWQEMEKY